MPLHRRFTMSSYTSYAVLDFETTGIGSTDRVIEIGVMLLDEHLQVKKTWDTLVYPERDIPNSFVHKITESDVAHAPTFAGGIRTRSEEHTSELQSRFDLVCRLLLEKKK